MNEITWNLSCIWIHITKVKNIVLVLWLPKQQISFQTSLFLKQHLFISGWNWLSRFLLTFVQSLHCVRKRRFLTNRLRSYYYGNIKTWTMFFRSVFCIDMQSFKWFRSIILKIYTIFQYVKICVNNLTS